MSKKVIYLFAPLEDTSVDRTEEIQGAVDYAQEGDSIVLTAGWYHLGRPLTLTAGVRISDSVFEKKKDGTQTTT